MFMLNYHNIKCLNGFHYFAYNFIVFYICIVLPFAYNTNALKASPVSSTLLSTLLATVNDSTSSTLPLATIKTKESYSMENLHASEHDIRLEDFFWSGSGDEPLTFSLKSNARLAANSFVGRETFVKTATVVATVYVDGNSEEDDESQCDSAKCDDSDDIPADYLPSDKRYWLITTVSGILTEDEFPVIEERLAELYRVAFTRQQSLHLGLTSALDASTTKLPAKTTATTTTPINETIRHAANISSQIKPTTVLNYENAATEKMSQISNNSTTILFPSMNLTTTLQMINSTYANVAQSHLRKRSVSSTVTSPALATTNVALPMATMRMLHNTNTYINANKETKSSPLNRSKPSSKKPVQNKKNKNEVLIRRVSVLIHNISVTSDDDSDYFDSQSEMLRSQVRNSSNSVNQTEIIYTVFVNGNPVLAVVAADDMKLLTEAEVAKAMDKVIYTKAEPYLKEMQATPLIPAATMTTENRSTILAMFYQNPYFFIFVIVILFIFTIMVMTSMLICGSKREPKTAGKGLISREAQTSQQSPLPQPPSTHLPPEKTTVKYLTRDRSINNNENIDQITEANEDNYKIIKTQSNKQAATQIPSIHGIDNFGYERDHSFILIPSPPKRKHNKKVGTPTIYFPRPPSTSPTTQSSATTTTSDSSSIYYIKKQKRDKAYDNNRHQIYAKKPKYIEYDKREYATIPKKQFDQKQKHSKQRGKYLKGGSNRVGAFEETVQIHSSHSSGSRREYNKNGIQQMDAISNDTFETSDGKESHFYEHIEAINPIVGKKNNSDINKKVPQTKYVERKDGIRYSTDGKVQNIFLEERLERTERLYRTKKSNDRKQRTENGNVTRKRNPKTAIKRINNVSRISDNDDDDPIKRDFLNEIPSQGDDLSIGSFLSMASVRSFPKCSAPEPLNRVLEPVSITHLDHYDETEAIAAATAAARIPRIVDTKIKNVQNEQRPSVTNVENETTYLSRTQSDGADPGIIGPVVWEIHKKQLTAQDSLSPLRDPVYTLNRYEDLIEGAMNLYTTVETTECHSIETITKEDIPGIVMTRDTRGKSADTSNSIPSNISLSNIYRPVTAMPSNKIDENTYPITSYRTAWSSATPSPMVRPVSGAPVTTHSSTIINSTTSQSTIVSSAPLIDSIHSDMEIFHRNITK